MLKNKKLLIQFFSSVHKQSTLYTCGPAVVSMVANYYKMLDENKSSSFGCASQVIFELESELFLSKLFNTTEELGTDAKYMAKQLKKMGCYLDYGQVKAGEDISFP